MAKKVDTVEVILMYLVAGMFDLLSLIPIVNWLVFLFAWPTFLLWFYFKGIKIGFGQKNAVTFLGVSLIEAIPALSMLPSWIALVFFKVTLPALEKTVTNKVVNKKDESLGEEGGKKDNEFDNYKNQKQKSSLPTKTKKAA